MKIIRKIFNKIRFKMMTDEDYARYVGVEFGHGCNISTRGFSSEPYLIKLGDNVRVAKGVCFFTHGGLIPFRTKDSDLDIFGKINIGNKVHIGQGAYIMAGVTIGDNCIVGAGSVVSKSVPSGYIVGGNPAKIISKTDDFLDRARMADFNTKKLSPEDKKNHLLENIDDPRYIVKKYMTI
ncbi:DapH/DapD/GlmU-related protein [Vibrio splendidus]